jgi:2-C-methyl-D-erythritol 2,4-cyclodiphosphate synthase
VNNIDATICLEKPKISPFVEEMKKAISAIVEIQPDDVAVKATTTEKLGFIGDEDGIAAIAVVLISK